MDIDERNGSSLGEQSFQPIILEEEIVPAAFITISEIKLSSLDFQKIGADRTAGLTMLRYATARVAGYDPDRRGASPDHMSKSGVLETGVSTPQRFIAAMNADPLKSMAAFGGTLQSFADSQKVMTSKEAADLMLAATSGNNCGGFKSGHQGSDLHHGLKNVNSGVSRHASALSGAGLIMPMLNWGWCAF